MSKFIQPEEFKEMTGATQPAKQCKVLQDNGIRFIIRSDGRPSLTWDAYNLQYSPSSNDDSMDFEWEGPRLEEI